MSGSRRRRRECRWVFVVTPRVERVAGFGGRFRDETVRWAVQRENASADLPLVLVRYERRRCGRCRQTVLQGRIAPVPRCGPVTAWLRWRRRESLPATHLPEGTPYRSRAGCRTRPDPLAAPLWSPWGLPSRRRAGRGDRVLWLPLAFNSRQAGLPPAHGRQGPRPSWGRTGGLTVHGLELRQIESTCARAAG